MFFVEFSAMSSVSCVLSNFVFISVIASVLFFLNLPAHTVSLPVDQLLFSLCIVFLFCGLPSELLLIVCIYGKMFDHSFHLPCGLIFLVMIFVSKRCYTFFFLSLMMCGFPLYYSMSESDFLD